MLCHVTWPNLTRVVCLPEPASSALQYIVHETPTRLLRLQIIGVTNNYYSTLFTIPTKNTSVGKLCKFFNSFSGVFFKFSIKK